MSINLHIILRLIVNRSILQINIFVYCLIISIKLWCTPTSIIRIWLHSNNPSLKSETHQEQICSCLTYSSGTESCRKRQLLANLTLNNAYFYYTALPCPSHCSNPVLKKAFIYLLTNRSGECIRSCFIAILDKFINLKTFFNHKS